MVSVNDFERRFQLRFGSRFQFGRRNSYVGQVGNGLELDCPNDREDLLAFYSTVISSWRTNKKGLSPDRCRILAEQLYDVRDASTNNPV